MKSTRTSAPRSRRWCRIAVATATALGTIGIATPAFAWPMCGY